MGDAQGRAGSAGRAAPAWAGVGGASAPRAADGRGRGGRREVRQIIWGARVAAAFRGFKPTPAGMLVSMTDHVQSGRGRLKSDGLRSYDAIMQVKIGIYS